jgi:hypothetical protein
MIDSNLSLLSQISADLETMHILLDKYGKDLFMKKGEKDKLKEKLVSIVNGFIKKMSTINDIDEITNNFDQIAEELEKVKHSLNIFDIDSVKQLIEGLHLELERVIKTETDSYLAKINFEL